MSRPKEPEIKQDLLEKCFKAILKSGSFDISVNELGESIGSSGRMLVYHFGSKANLEKSLIRFLELSLRREFELFAENRTDNKKFLLDFWDHFTRDKRLLSLLKLSNELSHYSVNKKSFRLIAEVETVAWVSMLTKYLGSEEVANAVLMLFQGALIDFMMTGDNSRGRRALETILSMALSESRSQESSR